MAAKLYVATYTPSGAAAWTEWVLPTGSEILAIDGTDVPGRGPVLGLIIKRPSGVYLETIALSEGNA